MLKFSKRLFNSLPSRLAISIILTVLLEPYMSLNIEMGLYTVSVILREALMFMVPLIIFSSIFSSFSKMHSSGLKLVLTLLTCMIFSCFFMLIISGMISYNIVYDSITANNYNPSNLSGLETFFNCSIPKIFSNDIFLFMGFAAAFLYNIKRFSIIEITAKVTEKFSTFFLKRLFIPLLPIFVSGFLIKLIHDGIIIHMISYNSHILVIMISTLVIYLSFMYIISTSLLKSSPLFIAKNIVTPVITGFLTTSSAAALPFSIQSAENNIKDSKMANAVMPVTVNIHGVGDALCIPILAVMLLKMFNYPLIPFSEYIFFSFMYVLTRFSGAGVPSGSIIVASPLLAKYMHFSPEMLSIAIIFYIFIDNLTTSANVAGNNLFVIIFDKIYKKFTKHKNI